METLDSEMVTLYTAGTTDSKKELNQQLLLQYLLLLNVTLAKDQPFLRPMGMLIYSRECEQHNSQFLFVLNRVAAILHHAITASYTCIFMGTDQGKLMSFFFTQERVYYLHRYKAW